MGGGSTATDGILAGRQATTVLTRTTWVTGTIFMTLALVLSIMSSRNFQPDSILLDELAPAAPVGQPILPTLEEEISEGQDVEPGEENPDP